MAFPLSKFWLRHCSDDIRVKSYVRIILGHPIPLNRGRIIAGLPKLHQFLLVALRSDNSPHYHGSLEGVGGLKTNEAYHLKADALLIPEMYFFFENLPTPFFGNVGFVIFGTFSALLALPVMIREEYGQMAHQTLPNILLSNASLVTKSCIARFVEGDAFSPSALSDCSTGPSPPLAHAKSTLSPSQTSAGCPRASLFCRFRSICEQTAHRSRKIRAQCERPPIHVLKTQVSCPSAQ